MIPVIVIDTCSLIELIFDHSDLIPLFEYSIKNKYLELAVPEIIYDEFEKTVSKRREKYIENLEKKYKEVKNIELFKSFNPTTQKNKELSQIDFTITTIRNLLNEGTKILLEEDISHICVKRNIQRLPPFTIKADSSKDGFIIFGSLKYCSNKNSSLIFISANHTDFTKNSDKKATSIDRSILEEYPNVEVKYFSILGKATEYFKTIIPNLLDEINTSSELNSTSNLIKIDRSKNIIDQIYDYLDIRFEFLSFLPIRFLANDYPFTIGEKSATYDYGNFRIINKDFFELFDNIELIDNEIVFKNNFAIYNTSEYQEKIAVIINCLHRNLIYNLTDQVTLKKATLTKKTKEEKCDCFICQYADFKFNKSYDILNSNLSDKDLLTTAFYFYKLGNYHKSVELYLEYIKRKDTNINTFIAKFNLQKLSIIIRRDFYCTPLHSEIEKKIKGINLYDELLSLGDEDKDIAKWLMEGRFYSSTLITLSSLVKKIEESYYNSLRDGFNSNNHLKSLILEFTSYNYFLTYNGIIFDVFTEHIQISELFCKGILLYCAINNPNFTRMEELDYSLVYKLLSYGNEDVFQNICNRFNISKLRYSSPDTFEKSFKTIFENLLSNVNNPFGNNRFLMTYNRIFRNILFFISKLDFKVDTLNKLYYSLFVYLFNEQLLDEKSKNLVISKAEYNGEKLRYRTLLKYFELVLTNSYYHEIYIFQSIASICHKNNIRLTINKKMSRIIYKKFISPDHLLRDNKTILLSLVYNTISNPAIKIDIKSALCYSINELNDFDIYYHSIIDDIIPFERELFDKMVKITLSKKLITNGSIRFLPRYSPINDLINICFKFNQFPEKKYLIKITKLDLYYKWLLNMEKFEYDKFDPEWIKEYQTSHYAKRIYLSGQTKRSLLKYLSVNRNTIIEDLFRDIYITKIWDK